jgi:succinate dehydrogenase flavin-adding protein (antitoxin of CptAB toxin-antitoxin module)
MNEKTSAKGERINLKNKEKTMMTDGDIKKYIITGEKSRCQYRKVHVDNLISQFADEFSDKLREREIHFYISSNKRIGICVDKDLMNWLVRSLLTYVMEITPAHGNIGIYYYLECGKFILCMESCKVSNRPKDLNEGDLELLGLLVEKMGGEFWISNLGRKSTRFFFLLPNRKL